MELKTVTTDKAAEQSTVDEIVEDITKIADRVRSLYIRQDIGCCNLERALSDLGQAGAELCDWVEHRNKYRREL